MDELEVGRLEREVVANHDHAVRSTLAGDDVAHVATELFEREAGSGAEVYVDGPIIEHRTLDFRILVQVFANIKGHGVHQPAEIPDHSVLELLFTDDLL